MLIYELHVLHTSALLLLPSAIADEGAQTVNSRSVGYDATGIFHQFHYHLCVHAGKKNKSTYRSLGLMFFF